MNTNVNTNANANLNFKISPKDSRDYVIDTVVNTVSNYGKFTSTTRVTQVDLSSKCTSVKNQGDVGSCTAFAVLSLYEYNHLRFGGDVKKDGKDGKDDIFSERFTYFDTRVNIEKSPATEDNGAYLRDTLKSLVKNGTCLEKTWNYFTKSEGSREDGESGEEKCNFSETPSEIAYEEAKKYQAKSYANIPVGKTLLERKNCLETLKGLLQKEYLFVGGFTCYTNLYKGVNGNILLPDKTDKIIGGHAVCFVGYDDIRKVFKFKNSWSSNWGDKGYGYIPYDYLLNGDLQDLWTITTQENNDKEIGIIQPKTSQEILEKAISDGLIAISEDKIPQVPEGLTSKMKTELTGFFNRIRNMKNNLKILKK